MKKYIFPKNFWWGAATSGPQTEGFNGKSHDSIMDYWFKQAPEEFYDGVGPDVASDFYHTYKEDIQLMKEIGMNSFRTSIQWTRLIDDLETASVNEKAKEYYTNVIDTLIENGIEPVINLFHFDMPIELQNKYDGWVGRESVELFVKYAKVAFDLFGDRVKYWAVFNEPMVIPEAGYMYGFHYPKEIGEGEKAVQIMYHLVLATAKTIDVFRKSRSAQRGGKICTILNLTPAYPATDSKEDLDASCFVDDFFNNVFVDTAVKGQFPRDLVDILKKDGVLWVYEEGDFDIIKKNTVDFLGVNYYHPKRVCARKKPIDEKKGWMPDKYFEEYDWPLKRVNPYRGWEIFPKAMYDIATSMNKKYPDMPWFISENGMGVEGENQHRNNKGMIEDDYRIEFYEEHLRWLHKAIQEGSNCMGFHAWTAFDCWSWNNAYKNRYGYISIDLKTQERTIKKSGYWLKEVCKHNGF